MGRELLEQGWPRERLGRRYLASGCPLAAQECVAGRLPYVRQASVDCKRQPRRREGRRGEG
jgi:hypothetical protein